MPSKNAPTTINEELDQATQEDSVRITRAYEELQSTKYYMYGIAGAGVLSLMMALKSVLTLVGVYGIVSDTTMVDFLELILVAFLFFEIGFIAKAAQVDSFENVKHKQFGMDCALGFVSLVFFLLDNLIRARLINGVLELLWTVPYTYRALFAAMSSYKAVKDAEVAKPAAGASFTVPKISTGAVASAVLGRLAKF